MILVAREPLFRQCLNGHGVDCHEVASSRGRARELLTGDHSCARAAPCARNDRQRRARGSGWPAARRPARSLRPLRARARAPVSRAHDRLPQMTEPVHKVRVRPNPLTTTSSPAAAALVARQGMKIDSSRRRRRLPQHPALLCLEELPWPPPPAHMESAKPSKIHYFPSQCCA